MSCQVRREAKRHESSSQANTGNVSVLKAPRYRRNDGKTLFGIFAVLFYCCSVFFLLYLPLIRTCQNLCTHVLDERHPIIYVVSRYPIFKRRLYEKQMVPRM